MIQGSTTETVDAIQTITKTMGKVEEFTTAIAASVDQQSGATQEISISVQSAADGTGGVYQVIGEVNQSIDETSRSANFVLEASTSVAERTNQLRSSVSHFLDTVSKI